MFSILFTPEGIAGITGVLLAVVFAYFPKLRIWYAALASEVKSYIMLGLLLLAEIVISLLSFYQVIVTQPPYGFETAIKIAIALVISNQPTYQLLPETADVRAARLVRDAKLLETFAPKKAVKVVKVVKPIKKAKK